MSTSGAIYLEQLARLVDLGVLRNTSMKIIVDPMHGGRRGLPPETA